MKSKKQETPVKNRRLDRYALIMLDTVFILLLEVGACSHFMPFTLPPLHMIRCCITRSVVHWQVSKCILPENTAGRKISKENDTTR